ncbi:SulP family inorganic anion transporter [Cytobacillus sp. FJAT-54145]|uniref:SulP family inorganic anion transporter n=1 Tax=Cytobacillus spartinae TaxID=3299023 RepID=A0ABW6K744_9BACI
MIYKLMPGLRFLLNYQRSFLSGDITAGITVAILFIPQCIAYSIIAGAPPIYGLYAATLPLLVYVLFGSSRFLSVGPVSIVGLLAFSGISSIVEPESSQFLGLVVLLGVVVGGIQFALGCIHFGKIVDFIPSALISGFTSAVALIIAFNQLKHLFGVKLTPYKEVVSFFTDLSLKLSQVNPYTLLIGIASMILLIVVKKFKPILPGSFIVVVLGTFIVAWTDLYRKDVSIVGTIPGGLPELTIPSIHMDTIMLLLPIAFGIAVISFLESYAVAKALADKNGDSLQANQELRGIGLANIASSFVGAIPVAGAFSRTAVNYQSGAKTNLSSIITVLIILITLLFFTPLFYFLPKSALAAIIIVSVIGLVDVKRAKYLMKHPQTDTVIFMVTFLATLFIGVLYGLVGGIILSILFVLAKKSL